MYTVENFRTKKALRAALVDGQVIEVFQPGPFGGAAPRNGGVSIEGPHYPAPHSWYARAILVDGKIRKILK